MKVFRMIWNFLLCLNLYASFRYNMYFRDSVLTVFIKLKELMEMIIKSL